MRTRSGVAVVAGLVLVGAVAVLSTSPIAPDLVEAGSPAPAFALPRLGGDAALSLAGLEGKVVLLNFWATWCKPCEDELPSMERVYRQIGAERFELVAISVDEHGSPVESFRQRYGLTFPILLDPDREIAKAYQTYRFPESFLIDAHGTVLQRYVGPRAWGAPEYVDRIRRLVEAGGVAP